MSIVTPIPPDLGPSPASSSTSSTSAFSFQTADLLEILEDLSTRFILNLPSSELSSIPRICFQVEQAFWFYEDFNRELNPSLPSYTLKRFSEIFFKVCPLLSEWSDEHERMFLEFMRYKMRVPVCGAILINETWDKCLLVKGWKGNTWSFPKGKINQEEPKHICAAREVLEETGYDCTHLLNKDNFLETNIQGQRVTLFIVPGVSQDYQFKTLTRKEIGAIQWFKLKHLPGWKRKNMSSGSSISSKVGNFKFYMILPFVQFLQQFIKDNKPRNLLKNGDTMPSTPSSYSLPQDSLASHPTESPATPKQSTISLDLMEPVVPEAEIPGTSSKSDSISALDELFERFLNSHESNATTFDEGERTKGTNTPVPTFISDPKPANLETVGETTSTLDSLFGNITLNHPQPRANLEVNLSASSSEFSSVAPSPSPIDVRTSALISSASSSTSSLDSFATSAGTAASASMYHVQPQSQPSGQPGWHGSQRAPNPSLLALLNPAYPSPSIDRRQPQSERFGAVSHSPMHPAYQSSLNTLGTSPLQSMPSYSSTSTSSSLNSMAMLENSPQTSLGDARLRGPVEPSASSFPSSSSSPSISPSSGADGTAATKNLTKEKMSLLQTFLSPPSVSKLPHQQQQQQQRQYQQQPLTHLERHHHPSPVNNFDGLNGDEIRQNRKEAQYLNIDHQPSVPSSSSHSVIPARPSAIDHPLPDRSSQTSLSAHYNSSTIGQGHQRTLAQHHSSINADQQPSHQPYPQPHLHLNHTPQGHQHQPQYQQLQSGHRDHYQSPSLSVDQPVGYHSSSTYSGASNELSLASSLALNARPHERQPHSSHSPMGEPSSQRGYPSLPHLSSPNAGSRNNAGERAMADEFQIRVPASYGPTQSSFASGLSHVQKIPGQNMPLSASAHPQTHQLQDHQHQAHQPEWQQEPHRPITVPLAQTSQHDFRIMGSQPLQQQQQQPHYPQRQDQPQNRELADRDRLRALLTGSSVGTPDLGKVVSGPINGVRPGAGGAGGGGAQSLLSILNSGGGLGGRGTGMGTGPGGRGNGAEAGVGRGQW